ncbi:MAG: flavodoxin family protein [Ilumatobacteraceae bacterium]
MARFSGLSAVLLNCSLVHDGSKSHTRLLLARVAGVMQAEGVDVEVIHMLDHQVGFGMVKDTTQIGDGFADEVDDWPAIHAKVMAADILVIGTPIWLGVKSSIATLVIERLYAYSGDTNEHGQYLYYGKAGGCVVTGNEDGVKAVSMETLYALSHIGYTIPPQADCGWLGEIGPGPSYGDTVEGSDVPAGFDSEFTNKNATIMSWNLMHAAKMLKDQGGFPVGGNVAATWRDGTNAADQDPEASF